VCPALRASLAAHASYAGQTEFVFIVLIDQIIIVSLHVFIADNIPTLAQYRRGITGIWLSFW
jgi:hypothetical protein